MNDERWTMNNEQWTMYMNNEQIYLRNIWVWSGAVFFARMTLARSAFHGFQIRFQRSRSTQALCFSKKRAAHWTSACKFWLRYSQRWALQSLVQVPSSLEWCLDSFLQPRPLSIRYIRLVLVCINAGVFDQDLILKISPRSTWYSIHICYQITKRLRPHRKRSLAQFYGWCSQQCR